MKIVDFHCDTISQIYDYKQNGENINLKENKLHLDLKKMKKSDYMLQVFAAYTNIKEESRGSFIKRFLSTLFNCL